MRKPQRFHNLFRPKVRQSWNKHNLYNIWNRAAREPLVRTPRTFFQQKWAAKSKGRGYHGEHVPEKMWMRLFSPRLRSVVDMPPQYLAAYDGSEQAAGRGSGLTTLDVSAATYTKTPPLTFSARPSATSLSNSNVNMLLADQHCKMTPYMQMIFAPLERRLDTAIFRALFASSVREARQFVIRGAVKVNGQKMRHPTYMLNPGDMFQVDIDLVMWATGEQKSGDSHTRLKENLVAREKRSQRFLAKTRDEAPPAAEASPAAEAPADKEAASPETAPEPPSAEELKKKERGTLKYLLKNVKKILEHSRKEFSAKEKKQLRLFRSDLKHFLPRASGQEATALGLVKGLSERLQSHELLRESVETAKSMAQDQEGSDETDADKAKQQEKDKPIDKLAMEKDLAGLSESQKKRAVRIMSDAHLSRQEIRELARILQDDERNPVDESKPYATPWRPRQYMAPFAFIPRYLEVNPNICAAVYLRHPVARQTMAEVPTPFNYLTNQLTHSWYTERG
ncbi:hypothetical protein CDD81_4249 [Ophiocordyceps australis]|uniref:RNA-binding S4 domain-containing protein n=1 Tax=Ophiocordyceps australis TaxID=1399860 RepID=A0A2C5XJ94_9HYPO|nr:hypothetical protein CDD81_4249 [Ophiocordyceps australis]